ncbi:DUF882 domain-containing protein [Aeromonas jandaei]|nr:DUF882 domain-containing protein [Aeromonas jandaei]
MELESEHFKARELRCKCPLCKQEQPHKVDRTALERLEQLRARVNRSLSLTSAYRCPKHPAEAKKAKPGQHALGLAFDIAVSDGAQAYQLQKAAYELGFNGIALGNGFVHVDIRKSTPVSWRY